MGNLDDIYAKQSYADIKRNLSADQSKLLQYYFDMGLVASTADDAFVVIPPIRLYTRKESEEQVQANIKNASENFKTNIKTSKKLDKKVDCKFFLFEQIRTIYPDFGKNMDKKVSPSEYSLYTKNKKLLKNALFYDSQSNNTVANTLLSYKDRLSHVIDTEEFSDACNIEDKFVISEIDMFFKLLKGLPAREKNDISKAKFKQDDKSLSVIDLANKLRTERIERTSKYSEIKKLYNKMRSSKYISLQNKVSHNER
jgi:hypothetical protein